LYIGSPIFFACMCAKIVVLVFKKTSFSLGGTKMRWKSSSLAHTHSLPLLYFIILNKCQKFMVPLLFSCVCTRRRRCISLVVYVCYGSECKKRIVKVSRFGRIRDELFVSSRDIKREIQPTEQCSFSAEPAAEAAFGAKLPK
jgi:hypothetical protein